MLTLTIMPETWLHRVPAGWKLVGLAVATVGIVSSDAGPVVAGVLCATILLYLVQGVVFARRGATLLRPLWPFLAVLLVWQVATGDAAHGVLVAGRMLATVALANLVTMTTRLDQMMAVIERAFGPLRVVGLSPRTIALALALAIRFTPVLMDRAASLRLAWRARSPRRPSWRLVAPLALLALDDADRVAEALRARGGSGVANEDEGHGQGSWNATSPMSRSSRR